MSVESVLTCVTSETILSRQLSAPAVAGRIRSRISQVSMRSTMGSAGSHSQFGRKLSTAGGGHLREFTDRESNFTSVIQQSVDVKGAHRAVMHQLISLAMKVGI